MPSANAPSGHDTCSQQIKELHRELFRLQFLVESRLPPPQGLLRPAPPELAHPGQRHPWTLPPDNLRLMQRAWTLMRGVSLRKLMRGSRSWKTTAPRKPPAVG